MELSKSANTCCNMFESLFVNSSNTPIRYAPDDVLSGPEDPIPIDPMYRSDPLAICISPDTSRAYIKTFIFTRCFGAHELMILRPVCCKTH